MTNMRHALLPLARAAAIALPMLIGTALVGPLSAQISVSISFDNFHNRLAPYGTWGRDPRWGDVWRPRAGSNFRPYYNGHWEYTREYGWFWASDENWGDVTYHYGRWVRDPRDGWLWVPGYVWGPSWVVWRSGGGNIGWFPMPPGDNYYGDGAYRDNFDNEYGYRDWYGPGFDNDQFLALWIFVGQDHFRDRNFRSYALPQRDYGRFVSQTRDTTNYVTINNYVVNRSIDPTRLQQDTNQRFAPVPARTVVGNNALVTQATVGRQIEQRERQQHPIPASAPAPAANAPRQTGNPAPQRAPLAAAPAESQGNRGRGNNPPEAAPPAAMQRQAPLSAPQRAPVAAAPTESQGNRGRGNSPPEASAPAAIQRQAPAAAAPQRAPVAAAPAESQGNRGRDNSPPGVVRPSATQRQAPAAAAPAGDQKKNDNSADRPGRGRGQN